MKFTPNQCRRNWRGALPHPALHYTNHETKLSRAKGSGWAQVICRFHICDLIERMGSKGRD